LCKGHIQNMEKKKFKFEISAGGIVFRKIGGKVEIAFLLDPYKKWTFAKGHPLNRSESLEMAAMRETKEELGLNKLRVVEKLGKIDLWFKKKEVLIHKPVHYFLMQAQNSAKLFPQKKEKIFKAKWVDIDEAVQFSDYKNIRPLLKKAILIIKKQPV